MLLKKLSVFGLAVALLSCAGAALRGSNALHYQCDNLKYKITYKDGFIDTSFVYSWKDSLIEASVWEGTTVQDLIDNTGAGLTQNCRELRTFRQEFLQMLMKRRTEEVSRKYTKEMSGSSRFSGELWFLLFVNPQGKCDRIFVLKNGISDQSFTREMVQYLARTAYKADESCEPQDLIVKWRFTEWARN